MGMSPHVARLRAAIGTDLLLLPAVSVLIEESGRLLLVRHAGHRDGWAVPGGSVELGESPAETAVRELREEIGVEIRLVRLVDVLGGRDYEVTYPSGDRTAYVTAVYKAQITSGTPVADQDEIADLGWFARGELPGIDLNRFARALLHATGHLARVPSG